MPLQAVSFFVVFLFLSLPAWPQQLYLDSVYSDIRVSTYTYFEKPGEALQLDVYAAEADSLKNRPLILYVHGGGFSGGSRQADNVVKFCRSMAARGYAAASMSYTLTMKGQSFGCDQPAPNKVETFRRAAQDANRAAAFFLQRADTFGIDPQQIVLAGSSAGAEAILHAAYWEETRNEDEGTPIFPEDFQYAGLISMAGALLNLDWVNISSAIPSQFFHGTCDNLVPYGTAPHHYCNPSDPGYMTLYGGKAIADKLAALGKGFYLYTACTGRHEWAGKPMTNNVDEITDFLYHDVLMGEKRQINLVVDSDQSACPEGYPNFNFCK
ncbi:MAG: alpha/beta hydrolase [Cyclobacteriaceae bacterium]